MMIAGILDACIEVTTAMGVTGDSRRTSRPKYTMTKRTPGREKKLL